MSVENRLRQCLLVALILAWGCAPPKPIPGVVRPAPGQPYLESLPGPMPGFGPFDSYSDALIAACPLILSKPNATAGRVGSQDFQVRWRVSSEYCAWVYYTPDQKYEMSLLTDQAKPTLGDRKTCKLPSFVDDQRYPASSLKYVFSVHNHPFEDNFSEDDFHHIVNEGLLHGFEVETNTKKVPLAIIAFFSNSGDVEHPTCDGFFEYVPGVGELLKWRQIQGHWKPKKLGTVEWLNATEYRIHWEHGSP